MVRNYNAQGLSVDRCLKIVGLSPNQYYHKSSGKPVGRRPSKTTKHKSPYSGEVTHVSNVDVLSRIVEIKLDPDHANYYRLITVTLCLQGYFINHKKVYRLMHEHLLLEDRKLVKGKNYVKYRRVVPQGALQILEMDIKYVYIHEKHRYCFVLTVIDTYTRYVLHWAAGYSMRTNQVKQVWEYILANYIQPIRGKSAEVEIEVRSDNGKQFSSKEIMTFFKENELTKVFTHPYTPQENGHIESFHSKLGKALNNDRYANLQALEKRLSQFYTVYNNKRSHGSLKGLPPAIFWALNELGYAEVIIDEEKRTSKILLNVAYQDILNIPKVNMYKYRALRA